MARTTVEAFLGRMRRQLHGGSHRLQSDTLAEELDASETDVTLTTGSSAGIVVGATLCVDLELMRVTAWDSGTKVATVIRGWLDSDAATHTNGSEVVLNPRFSPLDIYDAMVDEINSWGPELYKVASDEFTLATGDETLELPAAWSGMYGLIDARRKWDSVYQDTTAWPELKVRLYRGTTDWSLGASTSGLLLRFVEPVASGTAYLTAALPFSTSAPAMSADLVSSIGLAESQLDILGMGTKIRLMGDVEIGRSSRHAQDDPRRAEETPLGGTVQPLSLMLAQYRTRKQEEINKLRAKYPVRWT